MTRFDSPFSELASSSDQRIDSLTLLTPDEERQLLVNWNTTRTDYPEQVCIHHLFERQVERTPDAIAVSFGRRKLKYSELDRKANELARGLKAVGAGPEVLVGICVERSERMVVALMAILKAGAAYMPLDPGHPQARLALMAEDAGIAALITEKRLAGLFSNFRGPVICLDTDWKNDRSPARDRADEVEVCARNLAYVIYTSGSTGQPHGVEVEHRAVVNFLLSMQQEPGLSSQDRLLAVTTLCFDIAALEIFLPLTVGAELIVASREAAADGAQLAKELSRCAATAMQATPATWRMLVDSNWSGKPRLKVLCGGEPLSRQLATELLQRSESVWNLFGPTETTIWSLALRVADEPGPVLIGHPIANTCVYILDEQCRPLPIGFPGEIYIAGAGVARGYRNRPELTAERFVELPFNKSRAYKTGDVALYRSDGRIEYLGRKDFQVKLRGHRIELSEVESALRGVPGVKEAIVVARGLENERRLIAYLESDQNVPAPSVLKTILHEKLPGYMVPSEYVVMERLPLTPNGKIDRKALPEAPVRVVDNEFVAPRDQMESRLTAIWEEVLGVRAIGVTANFFDLGGHSMLAVRLISRIEADMGNNLPVAQLFQSPTIELLAHAIRGKSWENAWSVVVELQRGTTDPFFCVHSLGANLVSYRKLAKLSGPGQQFYGLQPYGLDGKHEPHTRIEDMARAYLTEIRQIQPNGPYNIGGVCLGGVIAFEMAQQLKAAGEDVSFLLLIDCEYPGAPENLHILPGWLAWADEHLGELFRAPFAEKLAYIRNRTLAFFDHLFTPIPATSPARDSSLIRATRHVMERSLQALFRYVPRPYNGKITLFCCTGRTNRLYADRRLAWGQVAGEGLEVHLISGKHMTMMDEPHVQVLAKTFRDCLERARHKEKSAEVRPFTPQGELSVANPHQR